MGVLAPKSTAAAMATGTPGDGKRSDANVLAAWYNSDFLIFGTGLQ